MSSTLILGIETSCDDTSVVLLEQKENTIPKILDLQLFNQETILKKFGGIVPEVASRNHAEKLPLLLEQMFKKTNLSIEDINSIAVTTHPGLLGPLLIGLNAAKTISLLQKIPINPVNHIYAHIEAIFLDLVSKEIKYPYIGLVVSGGHSAYFLVTSSYTFELLGTTIDDAAGEAFDKGGKLLNLSYPAGKVIDQRAKLGDPNRFKFPIGLKDKKNALLSFSGLKTSLKDFLIKHPEMNQENPHFDDLCASYQAAIVNALKLKLKFAIVKAEQLTNKNNLQIVVGGGVASNTKLHEVLTKSYPRVYFVPPKFCTDNSAMIANYALRTPKNCLSFPDCLNIDANSKIIHKKDHIK